MLIKKNSKYKTLKLRWEKNDLSCGSLHWEWFLFEHKKYQVTYSQNLRYQVRNLSFPDFMSLFANCSEYTLFGCFPCDSAGKHFASKSDRVIASQLYALSKWHFSGNQYFFQNLRGSQRTEAPAYITAIVFALAIFNVSLIFEGALEVATEPFSSQASTQNFDFKMDEK